MQPHIDTAAQPVCCLSKTERDTLLPCLISSFVSKSKLKEPQSIWFEAATVIQSSSCTVIRRLTFAGIALRRYLPTDSRSSAPTFVGLATVVNHQVTRNT